jgi:hypothetical protein
MDRQTQCRGRNGQLRRGQPHVVKRVAVRLSVTRKLPSSHPEPQVKYCPRPGLIEFHQRATQRMLETTVGGPKWPTGQGWPEPTGGAARQGDALPSCPRPGTVPVAGRVVKGNSIQDPEAYWLRPRGSFRQTWAVLAAWGGAGEGVTGGPAREPSKRDWQFGSLGSTPAGEAGPGGPRADGG